MQRGDSLKKKQGQAVKAIFCESLSKSFGAKRVIEDLSLEICRGERVAFLGCNGAGKTTLIRILLGEYLYGGEVLVLGHSPRCERTELLRKVAFVPQLPPPLRMPVQEIISFAIGTTGASRELIVGVAESLQLSINDIRSQPFNKLSGGQKQKLLIALALGRDVELLIMDEPAANLDPEARMAFFNLLEERTGDLTMLLSSHRIEEVSRLATRVIELDLGVIVRNESLIGETEQGSVLIENSTHLERGV